MGFQLQRDLIKIGKIGFAYVRKIQIPIPPLKTNTKKIQQGIPPLKTNTKNTTGKTLNMVGFALPCVASRITNIYTFREDALSGVPWGVGLGEAPAWSCPYWPDDAVDKPACGTRVVCTRPDPSGVNTL